MNLRFGNWYIGYISQLRLIPAYDSAVKSTKSDSYIFGSTPRPPESHSHFGSSSDAVCSWKVPFLSMNLAFGMIFVGDDVVLREGELQLEWCRQNHYFDVDIRCFDIAASVIDLPAFCGVTEIASSVEKVFTLPTILEDCYEFLLPFAMDYDVVVMLLLNFGGSQVMSPPDFVGFYAIEIDAKTLQLFLQIDVAPTTAGYFVASMLSVAESLVQSDTPHILSDVLCDASLDTELWSVCKLLLVFVGASVMLLLRDVFQF